MATFLRPDRLIITSLPPSDGELAATPSWRGRRPSRGPRGCRRRGTRPCRPSRRATRRCPTVSECQGGREVEHGLGDDPEVDEVDEGVVADVFEAAVVLVHPWGRQQDGLQLARASGHLQYSTVLLSVMTAALKPISTATAPARPPTARVPAATGAPRAKYSPR